VARMAFVLIGFALIALIDLIPLIRQRKKRAIAAFVGLFVLALTLSVLQVLNIEVFSTLGACGDFLKRIGLAYPA